MLFPHVKDTWKSPLERGDERSNSVEETHSVQATMSRKLSDKQRCQETRECKQDSEEIAWVLIVHDCVHKDVRHNRDVATDECIHEVGEDHD